MAKKIDHKERAHALLSPSGASRWLNCTPSARLEDSFNIKDEGSDYTKEGTLAHEFGELMLKLELGRIDLKGFNSQAAELQKSEFYSPEMPDEVKKYTNYVLDQYGHSKRLNGSTEILIEEKVFFDEYVEEGSGVCDSNIISDGVLEIIDLKYGKGLQVSAIDNPQLKLYGLGALQLYDMAYDIQKIKMTIVQPRLDHISTQEMTTDELYDWAEKEVKPKAALAYEGKGKQIAGDWCRWCKVKPRCEAITKEALKQAAKEFEDDSITEESLISNPGLLKDDTLIGIYEKLPLVLDWAKAVSEYILKEALRGKDWKGYKLVEGKSNRKWANDQAMITSLKAEGFHPAEYLNTKLKGIGDIEKLVGKEDLKIKYAKHIIKPPGKPTLVPLSDKRPQLNGAEQAKKDFS